MKRSGVILVISCILVAIASGTPAVLGGIGGTEFGAGWLVFAVGSVAIVSSIALVAILATLTKIRPRKCSSLLIASSLTTALVYFVAIVYLGFEMPEPLPGNYYSDYIRAMWLSSWFIVMFLALGLIGGVLIRLGSVSPPNPARA